MDKKQIQEFLKCKKDAIYFIEKYCYIQHPTLGIIPFHLYDFQRDIIKTVQSNRFVISNKSRQIGMSTLTASYALWMALFHKDKTIVVLSIKDKDAQDFLKKIKVAFRALPNWMREEPVLDNAHELVMTSGSSITSVSSSSSAARGRALSLLIIDECAFVESIETIWTSAYPALARGGSAIIVSTPNGISNFFYKTWKNASKYAPTEDRNEFHRVFVHWTQIPEYRGFKNVPHDWSLNQIIEEAKKHQWYKRMRPQFDDRRWAQEFEGDFLGSGNTVINPNVLKKTKDLLEDPVIRKNHFFQDDPNGGLWIWKEPENSFYIIGIDVASGDGTDYSTFQVLDILSGEQVAEYQGKCDIMTYAKLLSEVGNYYREALLVPESTGMGVGLIQKLQLEIGYMNIFKIRNEQTMKVKKDVYGWQTTKKTRPLLIQAIINYINSGDFKWRSKRLWDELVAFVWKESGKAEADGENNDDLVLALGMAAHNREIAMMQLPIGIMHNSNAPEENITDMWGDPIFPENKEDVEDIIRNPLESYIQSSEDSDEEVIEWLRS